MVRIWHFHCRALGSIPGRGTILHASQNTKANKQAATSGRIWPGTVEYRASQNQRNFTAATP